MNLGLLEVQNITEVKTITNDSTIRKLHEMRLTAMANTYEEQLHDLEINQLTFEERFGLLVDREWLRRKNNKLHRLVTRATLKFSNACVEDIEYYPDRELDRSLISRLSTCDYIQENTNIIIMGQVVMASHI